jgi:hypothetical protein
MELIEKFKMVTDGLGIKKPGGLRDDKPYPILEIIETKLMDNLAMTEIKLLRELDDVDDAHDDVFFDEVDGRGKYTIHLHPAYRKVITDRDVEEINNNPGKFKLIHKKGSCKVCYQLEIVV